MKVNNPNVKSGTQATNVASTRSARDIKGAKTDKNAPVTSAEDLAGSSKINMSERAQMMQKAKSIASADSVDEARVAHLQKMIDSGNYKVDAEAIADRLVDEHIATGE
jgi:negative regulator of flagellin synthesis FlgM